MAKVERDSGPNGGDRLLIKAGGIIKVFGLGTGGAQIQASGGQAANITARSVVSVTAGSVLASKANANFNTLASGMNTIITALKNIGVFASS